MFELKKKTNMKDLVTLSYNPVYNVCVEYYGDNEEVLHFFSILDIWGSHGSYEESGYLDNEDKWRASPKRRFELAKELLPYFRESLSFLLCRHNVEVQFIN